MPELFSLEAAAAIEARQDELLCQLDALNRRIEQAIVDFTMDWRGGVLASDLRGCGASDADPGVPTC
jgi:hypothetical protein